MISERIAKEIVKRFENIDWYAQEKRLTTNIDLGEWVVKVEAKLEGTFKTYSDEKTNYVGPMLVKQTCTIEKIEFIGESGEVESYDYEYLIKILEIRINRLVR